MDVLYAIRLKFVHLDYDKPTTKTEGHCHGIRMNGSRCTAKWSQHFYGFKFCRGHCQKASEWVRITSLDGKELQKSSDTMQSSARP